MGAGVSSVGIVGMVVMSAVLEEVEDRDVMDGGMNG